MANLFDLSFYKGKRVFITGHTGFKGSWLCRILLNAGADVYGYALKPPTTPNLYDMADIDPHIHSTIADIRWFGSLEEAFVAAKPDIVLHLAAQPLVRESYKNPKDTYGINVMGTVHILECIRKHGGSGNVLGADNAACAGNAVGAGNLDGAGNPACAGNVACAGNADCAGKWGGVGSFLNVTTDKVYLNKERAAGYREDEPLDGYDPYSNSKSCSELVTHSYAASFKDTLPPVSTARAGNVIGGGDFATDRIIPDCVRAMVGSESGDGAKSSIIVRNPQSIRPYQHVLEPLFAYLMIAAAQYHNPQLADWYNVGPDDCDCVTTGELADLFCKFWGDDAHWENRSETNAPHEANFLKLNCDKLKTTFGWSPRWHIADAVQKTVEWSKAWMNGEDVVKVMDRQIGEYLAGFSPASGFSNTEANHG